MNTSQLERYRAMLAEPDLPSILSAPLKDAVALIWPAIRAAQEAGDFDLAEKLVRTALESATPVSIAIFESRVASAKGEIQ